MRKHRKLTNPNSEMTKLKKLWAKSWSEEERDYWREQFASPRSNPELRQELETKYNIKLPHDTQLVRFKHWVAQEDARKAAAEKARANAAALKSEGLTGAKLRDELLKRMKEEALADGNFKLGADAVKLDLATERISISDRAVTVQEKRIASIEKAAEDAAQPGGLTPEVLEKIERELKLL